MLLTLKLCFASENCVDHFKVEFDIVRHKVPIVFPLQRAHDVMYVIVCR